MDPLGTGGRELARDLGRVVGVDLLPGEISLTESDNVAIAQVDGGQNQER